MLEFIVGFVVVACCIMLYVWWRYDCMDRALVEVDNEWWSNSDVRVRSLWED